MIAGCGVYEECLFLIVADVYVEQFVCVVIVVGVSGFRFGRFC